MQLFQDILRWMDDAPYSRLDLGSGDYRFKRELSNVKVGVTHGFIGSPSAAALMRETRRRPRRNAGITASKSVTSVTARLPPPPVYGRPGTAVTTTLAPATAGV